MQENLHDHIIFIEEKIQTICDQLTHPNLTAHERERCEAELRVAETALAHYRLAFELKEDIP